jgi:hypothetical protein
MQDNESNELNSFPQNDFEKQNQDSKPLIAGILLLIGGIMSILTWIAALSFDMSMIDPLLVENQNVTITPAQIQSIVQTCSVIGIILSVFPLIGGILSIQKKLWGGVLSCSIVGLFTVGPLFLSSVLALISLILVVYSKDQFA